jgi:RNA polymerase sigma factor (sigma-70 family)
MSTAGPPGSPRRAPAPKSPQPSEPESSFELVRRACAGDRDAEDAICTRYLPRLHAWARGRLPRGARPALETGDVVQEVLIRAIRSFPTFDPQHQGSFPAFLRTILTNRLRDLARVDQRRPPPDPLDTAVDPESPDASPFDLAIVLENRERFDAAMKQLSPADQELIFLRVELGCDYEEVAALLGRPSANATRVACRRAMLRLAEAMPAPPDA